MRRLLLLPAVVAVAACTTAPSVSEHPKPSPRELEEVTAVLKRDFRARGQATMDRVELDEVQRLCNLHADNPPAELARPIEETQLKAIPFPAGSMMGDWKNGEKIAQSGRGAMWSDKPGVQEGGSCYNCHQISPKETAFGTIGPSLAGYGKTRGNRPEIQRYVYGKIYNSKAYNACSQMPRLGHSKTLNEQQIKDLVALLLDPASPVNQ
ncbi:MAG: soxX [Burkholderiales bacterium]|jgi:sulfur-oxidizing protein SoxX|nr:soxX [Burkholderiales bacterium]